MLFGERAGFTSRPLCHVNTRRAHTFLCHLAVDSSVGHLYREALLWIWAVAPTVIMAFRMNGCRRARTRIEYKLLAVKLVTLLCKRKDLLI